MTGVDMLGCLLPPATGDQGGTHCVDCDHVVSVHSGHPVIIEEVSGVPRPDIWTFIWLWFNQEKLIQTQKVKLGGKG